MTGPVESAVTRAPVLRLRSLPRVHVDAVAIWLLVGGLVLYLGLDGGGYDIVVHSQAAVVVWWVVLVGAVWGLLPATRLTRLGWAALGLFSAFAAWTALGATWSISSERSLADLSLVVGYLGVLVLALSLYRDRGRAVRHTIAALCSAITLVALLSLAARLHPGLFPAATQTGSFLPGTARRLAWPLNYWNALAALLAFGLPLLLAVATSARTLYGQAAGAAAIPVVTLSGYLTFSRGGALAGAVAILVFLALSPERLAKFATTVVAAAGSAALIAAASHRGAIEHGLVNATARHQGATFVVPILLVCAGVALAQVGIGLASRHATPPRFLVVPPRRARVLLVGATAAFVVVAVAVGAPTKLSHAWRDFKRPTAAALNQASLNRFGTVSSNHRYDLWRIAVHTTRGHVAAGSGPGTYQLLALPRLPPSMGYVQNAHSLYFETLAELGVIGLVLLAGFILMVVVAALALVVRSRYEERVRAAGAAGALIAFAVSAAFDWVWQVPVLPVAFLLLAAAAMAPALHARAQPLVGPRFTLQRVTGALVALACLVAIAVPLATAEAVKASQVAAAQHNQLAALRDAREAAGIEPGASSAQIQLALVQELRGDIPAALQDARRAVRDEPGNWSNWLIVSRLQAEKGHAAASVAAFQRARSLNPNSPLFAHGR